MKNDYYDITSRAIVSLNPSRNGSAWIVRVNTPEKHRGKGLATKLMRQVIADADKEKIILKLMPVPSGTLNQSQLIDFYSKLGFKWKAGSDYGKWMERQPQ